MCPLRLILKINQAPALFTTGIGEVDVMLDSGATRFRMEGTQCEVQVHIVREVSIRDLGSCLSVPQPIKFSIQACTIATPG